MNPFDAIQLVTTPLALIAFIVAVVAWIYRAYSKKDIDIIKSARPEERAKVIQRFWEREGLGKLHPESLTKEQRYNLLVKNLDQRQKTLMWLLAAAIGTLIILSVTIIVIQLIDRTVPASRVTAQTATQGRSLLETATLDETSPTLTNVPAIVPTTTEPTSLAMIQQAQTPDSTRTVQSSNVLTSSPQLQPSPTPLCTVTEFTVSPDLGEVGTLFVMSGSGDCAGGERAVRFLVDGNEISQLGAPSHEATWNSSDATLGEHSIAMQIANQGDNDWTRAAEQVITVMITSSSATAAPTFTVTSTSSTPVSTTPAPTSLVLTLNAPVSSNSAWVPIIRNFDGVDMVLVPTGCFDMGLNGQSGHQCINEPFWIDKFEVTQQQFWDLGGLSRYGPSFNGTNRPVENITWIEARDFCALRGSRLPTEVEWEFAARGPNNLIYPSGNTWNPNNQVWDRSESQGTDDVGSRPGGSSWVGAMDMSGNVWEWVSSLARPYPYATDDGRESNEDMERRRVRRGGSWDSRDSAELRTDSRSDSLPDGYWYSIGFRCARVFNENDLNQ